MYELIENRSIVVRRVVFSIRKLRKDYSLNMGFEVEVDVIELRSRITNYVAVNAQLCLNQGELGIEFIRLAVKFLRVWQRGF
jgi:uncharacterized protein with ParB-like and HNH nuclease domain